MCVDPQAGDTEEVEVTCHLHEGWFAVADLAARLPLETVQRIFQDCALPLGELSLRRRKVAPAAIRRTSRGTVEGEPDAIHASNCGIARRRAHQARRACCK
jgi:poly-beta-hydroxyalkanoate depolymerase